MNSATVGLIAGGIVALAVVASALVYRIAAILMGDQLAQLALGLAVVIGLAVYAFDFLTGTPKK